MIRSDDWLLRCYPPAWRARYGDELQDLIAEASGDRRTPWRIRLDVVLGGARERLRASGLTGDSVPPAARARAGTLLVLCAWVLLVFAGLAVQKASEHWQAVTPASRQGLPAAAYDVLVGAAVAGALIALAGIACALPSILRCMRAGGLRKVRPALARAGLATIAAAAATVALVIWAHHLSDAQRNGHDSAYAAGFVACALLLLASAGTWMRAAVGAAWRIELSARVLRCEAWLAAALTATMGAVTVATAVWWAALADAAPWFFAGKPVGANVSALVPPIIAPLLLMSVATALAAAGVLRTMRSLPPEVRRVGARSPE